MDSKIKNKKKRGKIKTKQNFNFLQAELKFLCIHKVYIILNSSLPQEAYNSITSDKF